MASVHRRTKTGTFARVHHLWTARRWKDGYFDNRGRFRVYRPDYPRAYGEGYALRAHVVYWLKMGRVHPKGFVLHHKNEDKGDDRFTNLELVEHGKHTSLHHAEVHTFTCKQCRQPFRVSGGTVAKRRSEGNVPKFCSRSCLYKFPVSSETRRKKSIQSKRMWEERRKWEK